MADEDKPTEGAGGNEPHGEEPDYEAHYKAEKAHSRKREKQAKANRSAADELEKAREAGKTADERIAELTKRRDEKEKAEQRAKLAAKVAEKKGMPVELVVGDDEESMEAFADKMLTHFKKKPAAKVDKPSKLVVYQSECHCPKTRGPGHAGDAGFDYQSECHCSKTDGASFSLQRERAPCWSTLISSQESAGQQPFYPRVHRNSCRHHFPT